MDFLGALSAEDAGDGGAPGAAAGASSSDGSAERLGGDDEAVVSEVSVSEGGEGMVSDMEGVEDSGVDALAALSCVDSMPDAGIEGAGVDQDTGVDALAALSAGVESDKDADLPGVAAGGIVGAAGSALGGSSAAASGDQGASSSDNETEQQAAANNNTTTAAEAAAADASASAAVVAPVGAARDDEEAQMASPCASEPAAAPSAWSRVLALAAGADLDDGYEDGIAAEAAAAAAASKQLDEAADAKVAGGAVLFVLRCK